VRLGVVVVLRVPGKVVHRVKLLGVKLRKIGSVRRFTVRIANRGNVAELLGPGRLVEVTLWRRSRLIARVRATPRELLPGSRALVDVLYRGPLRGSLTCRISGGGVRGPRVHLVL
jgi:hypothetical protein